MTIILVIVAIITKILGGGAGALMSGFNQRLTVRAIADGFGLHPEVVSEALARWNITRPSPRRIYRSIPNVPFDEDTLRAL